jgi:ribulose-5-phosphate 4-epimerase/fuculose-1-phosphate aldolase
MLDLEREKTMTGSSSFSDVEWKVRCDLAACYRAFVLFGWTDLIYTHLSARHPTEEGHYLINPYGLLFDEITASNLIVVDFDGNVVRGDYPVNDDGHPIHSAVLAARPDVNWVLHSHTRAGMVVSCMKCGLLPLTQQAMFLRGSVSYHAWDLQRSEGECERLTADLGPNSTAMILNNHGLLSYGPTVASAFITLYTLEIACKVQADVVASGGEWIIPDADAIDRTAAVGRTEALGGDVEWEAVLRRLDKLDASYKT